MAIEIIPKSAEKEPLWLNILFYFFILLLVATVASNFVLDYFQKKSEKRLEDIEVEIQMAQTSEQKALKEKLSAYEKKINDFSVLLNLHQSSSNLFAILEKNTHPKVSFLEISFDSKENQANITCQTENFQILGEQIYIFKKENLIKSVNLISVSIGKGGKITSNIILFLDPQLFK